ncbi:MAG: transposase [Lachnospiraceae bacterium]|nr:transposase [Lachnospiraceae bacterium]
MKENVKISIDKKCLLNLEEAAIYTGVGTGKLRQLSNEANCPFVLFNGSKRLFKRKKLEEYLESSYSI